MGAAENAELNLKTYRSEKFGFEIAYPAGMVFKAYFYGASASLKDANQGSTLVEFEVWPASECPRQPAGTIAKGMGIDRAKAVTQVDGPDGSSFCGEPVTVKASASFHGAKIYELELTCMRETYTGSHNDSEEAEPKDTTVETEPIVTVIAPVSKTDNLSCRTPDRVRAGSDPNKGSSKHEAYAGVIPEAAELHLLVVEQGGDSAS